MPLLRIRIEFAFLKTEMVILRHWFKEPPKVHIEDPADAFFQIWSETEQIPRWWNPIRWLSLHDQGARGATRTANALDSKEISPRPHPPVDTKATPAAESVHHIGSRPNEAIDTRSIDVDTSKWSTAINILFVISCFVGGAFIGFIFAYLLGSSR